MSQKKLLDKEINMIKVRDFWNYRLHEFLYSQIGLHILQIYF